MIPNIIRIDLDGQKEIHTGITLSSGDINAYSLILEFYNGNFFYDVTGYILTVWAKNTGLQAPIPDTGTIENGRGKYTLKEKLPGPNGAG